MSSTELMWTRHSTSAGERRYVILSVNIYANELSHLKRKIVARLPCIFQELYFIVKLCNFCHCNRDYTPTSSYGTGTDARFQLNDTDLIPPMCGEFLLTPKKLEANDITTETPHAYMHTDVHVVQTCTLVHSYSHTCIHAYIHICIYHSYTYIYIYICILLLHSYAHALANKAIK